MSVLAETGAVHGAAYELPMDPIWYGVIALIVFAVLLAITFAFRGASHRHAPQAYEPPEDHADARAGGAGSGGH